jgi:hypothetical protein
MLIDAVPVPIGKLQDFAFPGIIAKNLESLKLAMHKQHRFPLH